jgi:hypothetical protein
MMGVAVPLPVINEEVVARAAVLDEELVAPVIDFSIPRRVRPIFGSVSYAQLKSGKIAIAGQTVRTAPLASLHLSEEAAKTLKDWILKAEFTLTEPVAMLPDDVEPALAFSFKYLRVFSRITFILLRFEPERPSIKASLVSDQRPSNSSCDI